MQAAKEGIVETKTQNIRREKKRSASRSPTRGMRR